MLKELIKLRDEGFPQDFLNRYAEYRIEYMHMPSEKKILWGFGYFLRMKYIEYLKDGNLNLNA